MKILDIKRADYKGEKGRWVHPKRGTGSQKSSFGFLRFLEGRERKERVLTLSEFP